MQLYAFLEVSGEFTYSWIAFTIKVDLNIIIFFFYHTSIVTCIACSIIAVLKGFFFCQSAYAKEFV